MRLSLPVAVAIGVLAGGGLALGDASHAGWPPDEHHEGHPNNESGELVGLPKVHNELLGGAGNDTIRAGNRGDVIWGDSHAGDQPTTQRDFLYGGPGNDWIYASHGYNDIWTGAGTDHVFITYGYGTVHCNGPGLKHLTVPYLASNRHYKLLGCTDRVLEKYKV
jgi:Ca2+-binding RTX toxin-like protein